jgi:hypothetical protein
MTPVVTGERVATCRVRFARRLAIVAASLAILIAIGPIAPAQTWTNGAGTGLWSNNANWSATPGINRTFNDTAVGSSTADGNRTGLSALNVSNSSSTHAVNLAAGTLSFSGFPELNIGLSARGSIEFSNGSISMATSGAQPMEIGRAVTAAADGTMAGTSTLQATLAAGGLSLIGHADGAFGATGVLDMANSNNGSLTLGSLRAGWANSSGPASATMSFGNNWAFTIGTAGARSDFNLGYASAGTGSGSFTTGTGGSFTAYTSTLNIGAGSNTTSKTSTMNLSGINNGLIDHSGGNGSFNIGRGAGSGSLAVGSGWTMNWNVTAAYIGYDGGTGSVTGTNMTLSGSIPYLYVGTRDSAGTGGYGTLDMGGGSMGSGLVVSTSLRIGNGGDSTGTVKFGSGLVSSIAQTDIGDTTASGVEGLMELRGTQFTSGSSAAFNVNNSGRLNIYVSNTSSGLILTRGNSAALTIADTVANGNGIFATFLNNPTGYDYLGTAGDPIYWAMKWSGDQTASLNSLISAGKIGWDASGLTAGLAGQTPQSFYDAGTDSTYLGYYVTAVPEPGSFALAACGMALAGWSIARRRARAAG